MSDAGERKKSEPADAPGTLWTRRSALNGIAWGLVVTSGTTSMAAAARALFPRVIPAPPTRVTLCRPDELAVGEVSERWKKSDRIFLVRQSEGLYALRSVCTHLGCVAGWQGAQHKFKCFCHGSGFRPDGTNFEGPAPRALERLGIALDEGGRVVVDKGLRFRAERGEWNRPGAFLRWPGPSAVNGKKA